eukprot:IDg7097t1
MKIWAMALRRTANDNDNAIDIPPALRTSPSPPSSSRGRNRASRTISCDSEEGKTAVQQQSRSHDLAFRLLIWTRKRPKSRWKKINEL